MKVRSWDEFERQGEAMFRNDPIGTRVIIKYKHTKGKLTVKVTDDKMAVVYDTDQESDLEKVDQMSLRMMSMMAQGVELADLAAQEEMVAEKPKEAQPQNPKQKQRRKR